MAGPLAAIERFFERLLERPAARLFQVRLEPVQIQRQLERAMESERRLGSRRTYVPNSYRVMLHPDDLLAFDSYRDSLSADLAEALHSHARSRGYTLTARPRVQLEASPRVTAGDVLVQAQPIQPPRPRPATEERDPLRGAASANRQVAPSDQPRVADDPGPAAGAGSGATTGSSAGTSAYSAPRTNVPNAVLAIRVPGRSVERVPVRSGTVRVGRALDNDVVLVDDRVSRYHGQFGVRFGTLVYSDLGSTNGSFLNGTSVTEIALGPGDVLQLGSSTLAIEQGD